MSAPAPAPDRSRHRPARRGSVLVIAGVLVVLLGLGIFSFQQVMRQRYLEANQHHLGEVALTLAESGLAFGLEHLQESSRTPGTLFYDVLVQQRTDSMGASTFALSGDGLDRLVSALDDATLEVDVELGEGRPFEVPGGLRGIVPDPREKALEVTLVARASYRGLERVARLAQPLRVVRVTPPVLSKFTLFLRQRGGQEVNLLENDPVATGNGIELDGSPAAPLVLYHREEPYPAVVDQRFHSLASIFDDTFALDGGGLVYLGGEEPWTLNLTHGVGDGRYEELFQLRRTRYRFPSELPGVNLEYGMYFGMYPGVMDSPQLGSAAGDYRRSDGSVVTDRVGALRLYGDVHDVSPTIVLGPVYRSFLTMRLLDGLWFPWLERGEFSALSAVYPAFADGGYDAYQQVMPRVVTESYNRAYDFVSSNTETLLDEGEVDAAGTPFFPPSTLRPPRLTRVAPPAGADDEAFLYPSLGEEVPGRVALTREIMGETETVFSGALADLDAPLFEELLQRRRTHVFQDGAGFLDAQVQGATLAMRGVAWIEAGELELPAFTVGGPTMVVADGSIVIQGAIDPSADGSPLTLVSRNGDIRVETSEPVHACLVALRGRLLSRGALDIRGAVAAESLALRDMVRGGEPKEIRYDEDLDPTDEESYWKAFAVVLAPDVRTAVARQ